MSKARKGSNVKVHYVGTLNDGSEFDNSYKMGEPMGFKIGDGKLLKKFDESVKGMSVGEKKKIVLSPEEGYGQPNPNARQVVPKDAFGENVTNLAVGARVSGQSEEGHPVVAMIVAIDNDGVTLDLNHPLAGKDLNFEIELVDIVKKK